MPSFSLRRWIRVFVGVEIIVGIVGLAFGLREFIDNENWMDFDEGMTWAFVGALIPLIPGLALILALSGNQETRLSPGGRLVEFLVWLVVAVITMGIIAYPFGLIFGAAIGPTPSPQNAWGEKADKIGFFVGECLCVCASLHTLVWLRPLLASKRWWKTAIRTAAVVGLVVAPVLGGAAGGATLASANLSTAGGVGLLLLVPMYAGIAIPFGLILGLAVGALVGLVKQRST